MQKPHPKQTTQSQSQSGPVGPTTATQTPVAGGGKKPNVQPVPVEAIRLRAYRKWESAGRPDGDDTKFWLAAEQELIQGK